MKPVFLWALGQTFDVLRKIMQVWAFIHYRRVDVPSQPRIAKFGQGTLWDWRKIDSIASKHIGFQNSDLQVSDRHKIVTEK